MSDAQASMATVRVGLPYHLRNLAHVTGDVTLEVAPPVTLFSGLRLLSLLKTRQLRSASNDLSAKCTSMLLVNVQPDDSS